MAISDLYNMTPEQLWAFSEQLAALGPPEAVGQGNEAASGLGVGLVPNPLTPEVIDASAALAQQPGPVPPQRLTTNPTAGALAPAPAPTPSPPSNEDLMLAMSQLQPTPPPEVVRPPGGSVNVGGGRPAQNLIAQLLVGAPARPIRTLGG